MAKIDVDAEINSVRNKVQTVKPSTTGAGYSHSFVKADGMYLVDQNGIETGPFGAGGVDISCRVTHSVAFSLPDTTITVLPFDLEDYDTDVIHDTVTNNSRLTAQTAGKYTIIGNVAFASAETAPNKGELFIKKNGSDYIARVSYEVRYGEYMVITTQINLSVGDFVELAAKQVSGAAVDITKTGQSPYFMMALIEPVAAGGGLDIGARVYNDADVVVVTDTMTTVPFNSADYDTDDIHNPATNNSRLTCKTAGKYLIEGQIAFSDLGASPVAISMLIYLNETKYISQKAMAISGLPFIQISTIYDLEIGDYVELRARHFTGSNKNLTYNADQTPYFMMQRIG